MMLQSHATAISMQVNYSLYVYITFYSWHNTNYCNKCCLCSIQSVQTFEMEPLFTIVTADHILTIIRKSANIKDKTFFYFSFTFGLWNRKRWNYLCFSNKYECSLSLLYTKEVGSSLSSKLVSMAIEHNLLG